MLPITYRRCTGVTDQEGTASAAVITVLTFAVVALGLLLAAWTGVQVYRRRPTSEAQMVAAIVLEAALLAQSVIAVVRLAGDVSVSEPATFVAYSAGVLLPVPLGFYLARIERTRWGSLCLSFTAVVVAVMTLRLLQLWRATGG